MFQSKEHKVMDRRIGKILSLILALCGSLCAQQPSIKLKLLDVEENQIRQAEQGVPFLLQVIIENIDGAKQPEHIDGFSNFDVRHYGTESQTNIINYERHEKLTFNYLLTSHNKGAFQIGPVEMTTRDGKVIKSDTLHFHVADETVALTVHKKPYFLKVSVDKKSAYLGELITLNVRFYYAQDYERLKFVEPAFNGIKLGDIAESKTVGKEEIFGAQYSYKELIWSVYPEKVGHVLIPTIQGVFSVPSSHQHGFGSLFSMISMNPEKSVYSAPRSLQVKMLPESQEFNNVTAVGQFDRAQLLLQKDEAKVGEGLVATMSVSGVGNFDLIDAPKLQLPENIKYYESNSRVEKINNQKSEKIFEYILQADEAASFDLSSQTFAYFDPVDEAYKTLATNSVSLNIIVDQHAQSKKEDKAQESQVTPQDKVSSYVFKSDEIDYVIKSGMGYPAIDELNAYQTISWILMIMLCLFGLILFYWSYMYLFGIPLLQTYWLSYVVIRLSALRAYQQQDLRVLYNLLKTVCEKYDLQLHSQQTAELLQSKKSWNTFLSRIEEFLFSGRPEIKKEKQKLMLESIGWVKKLLIACRLLTFVHYKKIRGAE